MKIRIWQLLYRLFAKGLPLSGQIAAAKALRAFFFRKIALHAGRNINIERGSVFNHWVSLGNRSGIGVNCEMNAGGKDGIITIGDDVMMGPNVVVYTRNHASERTDIPMLDQGFEAPRPVKIGSDVWIGRNVIILPGVTIGDGCIIGAGAVVSKDIPPYSVAVGVPARVVKHRRNEDMHSNECNMDKEGTN